MHMQSPANVGGSPSLPPMTNELVYEASLDLAPTTPPDLSGTPFSLGCQGWIEVHGFLNRFNSPYAVALIRYLANSGLDVVIDLADVPSIEPEFLIAVAPLPVRFMNASPHCAQVISKYCG